MADRVISYPTPAWRSRFSCFHATPVSRGSQQPDDTAAWTANTSATQEHGPVGGCLAYEKLPAEPGPATRFGISVGRGRSLRFGGIWLVASRAYTAVGAVCLLICACWTRRCAGDAFCRLLRRSSIALKLRRAAASALSPPRYKTPEPPRGPGRMAAEAGYPD